MELFPWLIDAGCVGRSGIVPPVRPGCRASPESPVARRLGHSASIPDALIAAGAVQGGQGALPLLSSKAPPTELSLPALRSGSVQQGPCEAAFPLQPHSRGPGKHGGPVAAEPKMHFRSTVLQKGLDPENAAVPEALNQP